ncbi:AmmeMemoRadiSam system protein B [Fervidobacterium islandicum]|uniref:MEMO1 family protein NA23_08300 n=1 Tax=Fervidobacterium islandicum TaxID=2423 RepID=A0AAI8GDL3_FERIS|nr:AmmeMemoRadiSam system protein B [Fervidobacterium islandicum]AMW33237.1 AmmeMemoRadiSam system protein B [Fervidobacterium islandicum]
MNRRPVVAGKFYPGTPNQLASVCEAFVGNEKPKNYLSHPIGLILPHAGYVYSGKTAGLGIRRAIEFGRPRNIIILGPNHTGYGAAVSVWREGEWYVPNGSVKISTEIADEIIDGKLISDDEAAHLYEHSIEVQLPLLIHAFGEFQFVPICMMDQRLSTARYVAERIRKILEKYPDTIVVASSDFNHYDPHEITIKKDEIAIQRILANDLEGLYEDLRKYDITMCGPGPVAVVRSLFNHAELVYHTTSAEFSQDYSYTVGYASFILW